MQCVKNRFFKYATNNRSRLESRAVSKRLRRRASSVLRAHLLAISNPGALRPQVLYQRVHVRFRQA